MACVLDEDDRAPLKSIRRGLEDGREAIDDVGRSRAGEPEEDHTRRADVDTHVREKAHASAKTYAADGAAADVAFPVDRHRTPLRDGEVDLLELLVLEPAIRALDVADLDATQAELNRALRPRGQAGRRSPTFSGR